jgi:hypothetical protein
VRRRDQPTVPFIKTTVELPRAILNQAKHYAIENHTTLKSLIIAGLKKQIAQRGR